MNSILNTISYHAVYDDSIMDALQFASQHCFSGVQVAVESPHLSFDALTADECGETVRFCDEKRLLVSLHCPDDVTSLFTFSRPLVEGIFAYYESLFAFAEKIGSRLITVHLGRPSSFGTDTEARLLMPEQDVPMHAQTVTTNLQRLVELAAGRFVLCVENYRMDPLVFDILQPYLERNELTLCWDLANTYDAQMNINKPMEDYFRRNVAFVRQVHLHDVRDGHSHRVIGSGDLDFMRFLPELAEANVLEYCIEVRPREKALESLLNLRSIVQGCNMRKRKDRGYTGRC